MELQGREIPAETAAALVMACVAIDDLLCTGKLTADIREELEIIQPYLDNFMEMA